VAVAVVTDTTHYLPPDYVSSRGIHEVSLYVTFQGKQVREAEIMRDTDAFYDGLRAADDLPTTSQPSIGDFLGVWEPLVRDGQDIVSIHIASSISGTYQSALQAKARLVEDGLDDSRIAVVDSRSGCGGLGLIVLAAAAAARTGNVEEVAERARAAAATMTMWFAVDTLEYLRRGGRIGAAQAWLGGALKVKPILTLREEITPIERVRTSARAFERMADYLQTLKDDGHDAWVVQHIQAADVAERLVERGRGIFGTEPCFVSQVGPVIGAHVGPGLIGVGALPTSLLA
jgi:fatty acid kinase fatty acid binding subunit